MAKKRRALRDMLDGPKTSKRKFKRSNPYFSVKPEDGKATEYHIRLLPQIDSPQPFYEVDQHYMEGPQNEDGREPKGATCPHWWDVVVEDKKKPTRCLACDIYAASLELLAFDDPVARSVRRYLAPKETYYANAVLVGQNEVDEDVKWIRKPKVGIFRMTSSVYEKVKAGFRSKYRIDEVNISDENDGRIFTLAAIPNDFAWNYSNLSWSEQSHDMDDPESFRGRGHCGENWRSRLHDLHEMNTGVPLTNSWTKKCLKKSLGDHYKKAISIYKEWRQ